MNYPLHKTNKEHPEILTPARSSYSDAYAERMCDLYLSDHICFPCFYAPVFCTVLKKSNSSFTYLTVVEKIIPLRSFRYRPCAGSAHIHER